MILVMISLRGKFSNNAILNHFFYRPTPGMDSLRPKEIHLPSWEALFFARIPPPQRFTLPVYRRVLRCRLPSREIKFQKMKFPGRISETRGKK